VGRQPYRPFHERGGSAPGSLLRRKHVRSGSDLSLVGHPPARSHSPSLRSAGAQNPSGCFQSIFHHTGEGLNASLALFPGMTLAYLTGGGGHRRGPGTGPVGRKPCSVRHSRW